jgi:hypothetical protein
MRTFCHLQKKVKTLHAFPHTHFSWRKSQLAFREKSFGEKTGSEKNPRQHERKNVSFQLFSFTTYSSHGKYLEISDLEMVGEEK